jgi:hypothetical protein
MLTVACAMGIMHVPADRDAASRSPLPAGDTRGRSGSMRMSLLLSVATLFVATSVHALSADQLVAKNLEARGGLDKIHAITTLKLEGKLRIGGQFELTFASYQKAPQSVRIEATIQGLTQIQAWDGKDAWQISPFQGRRDPEKMSEDDARSLADDAAIGGPLVDWKAHGSTLAYQGTEDIDGTQAHKLKLTLKNGDIDYVYLDPDYFLEIRRISQLTVRGTHVKVVTDYGDYERVNGVYFPFSTTIQSQDGGDGGGTQQLTVTKSSANVPIDNSLFAFPASAETGHATEGAK